MELTEKIGSLLILAGAAWMFLGTLGLLRFPDVYTRLHATGLASTGGVALILSGVVVHFAPRTVSVSLLAGLTLIFVLLSYPLATTAMIWAAHRTGVAKFRGTLVDEMELYDHQEMGEGARAVAEAEEAEGSGDSTV